MLDQNSRPTVILTSLHSDWIPDVVVMEGMFLINIKPWIGHKNLGEYADFLLKQHIHPYFRSGSHEVHLLFDDPHSQAQSPKFCIEMRAIQCLKVTNAGNFPGSHPSGGKMSLTVGTAKGALSVSSPIIF